MTKAKPHLTEEQRAQIQIEIAAERGRRVPWKILERRFGMSRSQLYLIKEGLRRTYLRMPSSSQ